MDPKPSCLCLEASWPSWVFPAQVLLEVGSPALPQEKTQKSLQVLMSAKKYLCLFQVPLQKLCYHN